MQMMTAKPGLSGPVRAGNQPGGKSNANPALAVRGRQAGALSPLVINGDGTVTDTAAGLMWEQNKASEIFSDYTWETALSYSQNLMLGGYDDWRFAQYQGARVSRGLWKI